MSTYEGQYEPKDSRDVTLSNERAPGEPDRTGHREGEARQQEQQADASKGDSKDGPEENKSQVAYGNSKDREGQMEQDIATDGAKNSTKGDESLVGETSADPATRAKADGNRPLSGD